MTVRSIFFHLYNDFEKCSSNRPDTKNDSKIFVWSLQWQYTPGLENKNIVANLNVNDKAMQTIMGSELNFLSPMSAMKQFSQKVRCVRVIYTHCMRWTVKITSWEIPGICMLTFLNRFLVNTKNCVCMTVKLSKHVFF